MTPEQALALALRFLDAFKEAGGIYDDYLAAENVTEDDYHDMLGQLRTILAAKHQKGSS